MARQRSTTAHRPRPLRSFGRAVSWHRRKLAVLAAIGAVLTGVSAAAPPGPPTIDVVRARTQLAGGAMLTADDLSVDRVVAADAPAGAVTETEALVGKTLAAPVAARQVLTALAVVTARSAVSPAHVLAPMKIADLDLAAQLRPGDRVDVLAADDTSPKASVVAVGARVVTVPQIDPEAQNASTGALILVDVDAQTAALLARAAVSATLTVIWRP